MKRVVYIEDSDGWRRTIGERLLTSGLKRDDTVVQVCGDFEQVRQDLTTDDLANVYITDNEIVGEDNDGASIAMELKDKARKLNREILIITLLCSNPDGVIRRYGKELESRQIPVLDKLEDAVLCGFWAGKVLNTGEIEDYNSWLSSEDITTLKNPDSRREVNNILLVSIEPGCLRGSCKEFVTSRWDELTKWEKPRVVDAIAEMFNITSQVERPNTPNHRERM